MVHVSNHKALLDITYVTHTLVGSFAELSVMEGLLHKIEQKVAPGFDLPEAMLEIVSICGRWILN